MEHFFLVDSTVLEEFLKIVLILLPILNPFITSNPENKSLVTEVIYSKLCE